MPKEIKLLINRRRVLAGVGSGVVSAAALATLVTGSAPRALAKNVGVDKSRDAAILNAALAAEFQAIAAYQVGADSGLLKGDVLKLAVQFQGQHRAHADALSSAVDNLGTRPAKPKTHYGFPVEKLKTGEDVLRFAAGLEKGAVSAYLSSVPSFANNDFSKVAASILGDEAMHWAVLLQVLGENPAPDAFVS